MHYPITYNMKGKNRPRTGNKVTILNSEKPRYTGRLPTRYQPPGALATVVVLISCLQSILVFNQCLATITDEPLLTPEPTPWYTGSNFPTKTTTFPPTVAPCAFDNRSECVQEGCLWTGRKCKSCATLGREVSCTRRGCLWDTDQGTCSSCNDIRGGSKCLGQLCRWDDDTCTSCSIHQKKNTCVDAKCAWRGKRGGCVPCGKIKKEAECIKTDCKWTSATDECSADVKPFNKRKACIGRGGHYDSTVKEGPKCTKCSSLFYWECGDYSSCILGGHSGQTCKSCKEFKKKAVCMNNPGCGYNKKEGKCMPCASAIWAKNICERRYKCAWDNTKEKGEDGVCRPCTDITEKEICQAAPSCGWRERGECVMKPYGVSNETSLDIDDV